MYQEELFTR